MNKAWDPKVMLSYDRRQRIKALPGVLALYFRLFNRAKLNQLTTGATVLCLEGFPRSGNSFSFLCVVTLLGIPSGAISHHTHSPANVVRAVRRRLPTYVFIREPHAACISLLLYGACDTLEESLQNYEDFYRPLLPLLDRVTVVPFENLIKNPGDLLDRLADDFKRDRVSWTAETAASIEEIVRRADEQFQVAKYDRNSLPSAEKERKKADLAAGGLSPVAAERLARCVALRNQVLENATDILGPAAAG